MECCHLFPQEVEKLQQQKKRQTHSVEQMSREKASGISSDEMMMVYLKLPFRVRILMKEHVDGLCLQSTFNSSRTKLAEPIVVAFHADEIRSLMIA